MRGRVVHGEQSMGGDLMRGQHKPLQHKPSRPHSMPDTRADRASLPARWLCYLAANWPELLTLTFFVLPPLVHWPYQAPSPPMDSADRLLQP